MIDRRRQLSRIRAASRQVEWRMRFGRALAFLPTALTAGLAASAATLAVTKVFPGALSELRARQLLAFFAASVVAGFVIALARRIAPRAGALALDKHHGLAGRLSNALAFDETPAKERSPLMEVAIDDACAHAGALAPSKAAPIRLPRDFGVTGLVALGVLAVAAFEVRTPRREMAMAKTIDALTMTPDDIALFREMAKELDRPDQTPEVKAALERFNQLIEDIANKRLDRTEAFRRMEAIERELLKGAEADKKAMEDALTQTAEELKRSDLTKPLADSLAKKDLDKAKKDLKDLAEKLKDKKKKIDKADLEKLKKALEKAAAKRKEALEALNQKRQELREDLLKKKQQQQNADGGAPDPKEQALLKQKERELERLDRQAEQQERANKQLSKLDRDLAKAAEDLMRDLGDAAKDLEQAADSLNEMQQQEMTDKEKEELKKKLEELREVLRQQGQGGKKRMARMLKFGKKARGGKGGQQGQSGEPQDGEGKDGDEKDGEGKDGEGKDGEGGEGQNGKNGQGQKWAIGPGGKKILMPGGGGAGEKGGGQGNQPGDGGGQGGKEAGKGSGGPVAGNKTDLKVETHDVEAQAVDSGKGPSNSEVILSAAEKGFRGAPYKKVFTKYSTHAEEQINKDTIPDGYRFYVNRYFQLIRPRE